MKKAKITKQGGYKCAPSGHTIITVPFGTVVDGQIAEWALADKAASAMFDPVAERKVIVPAETKGITEGRSERGGINETPSERITRPAAPQPYKAKRKGRI